MKLWNIFESFVSTDSGEIINKINDYKYLRDTGTVYREQGNLITGSDGSIMWLLDTGDRADRGAPRIAVNSDAGVFGEEGF